MAKAKRKTPSEVYFEFPRNLLEDIAWMRLKEKREAGLKSLEGFIPPPEPEKVVAEEGE